MDTTDKAVFPVGGAKGSLKKVEEWEAMPQVMTLSTEGGEQQTQEIQFLEDEQAETVDTFKNGITQVYTFAHDAKLPIRKLLMKLDDSKQITAMRFSINVPVRIVILLLRSLSSACPIQLSTRLKTW
ncbi:phage tail protein [Arsenophonus apicola]|uniref:phage tail protein n=1 Tax=Arsenophonus apicola TaxID=2879119 RepID=UPI0021079E17|nr:phage tail protein [Arsenophonus apicola]